MVVMSEYDCALAFWGEGEEVVCADAVKIAMGFTSPVVTSLLTVSGSCASGTGTCVIVNKDGWIVIAAHIIEQISNLNQAEAQTRALEARGSGQMDPALPRRERRRLSAQAKGPKPDDIDKWSVWWENDAWALNLSQIFGVEGADIAVARLSGFDLATIANFPVFRDPSKDFLPGTSLCRLGFPFYQIGTNFDKAVGK